MVHVNNCTSDLNAWVNIFREYSAELGIEISTEKLYGTLYRKALEGDADCGGLLSYGYFSGENITGLEEGRQLFVRTPDSKFNLANMMRTHLYSALGTLKLGMDILLDKENVSLTECSVTADCLKQGRWSEVYGCRYKYTCFTYGNSR